MDGFDVSSNKKPVTAEDEKTPPNTSSADVVKQLVAATEPAAEPAAVTEPAEVSEDEQMEMSFVEREAAEAAQRTKEREAEVSSGMRDKLRGELASQGAYANKKSANPILIISGIVAVLVILGGKDILFWF